MDFTIVQGVNSKELTKDHNIISNGSYPWWGAFLSKTNSNKKIVCPTNYVKTNHPSSWINGNYYPSNWLNIDNYE